jgi:hypothetical protein
METEDYDDLLRRLATLVAKLDSTYDALLAANTEQREFNRRLTAAIERLDVTQATLTSLMDRVFQQRHNGQETA